MTRQERVAKLLKAINERVLVLDGAMGTALQARDLTAADFGGPELEGCNESLNLTRPDVIRDILKEYLLSGADIVETNTFGSTPLVLAEYNLQDKAHEITVAAARIAREAADSVSTPDRPRFVAGSMGPTTKAISVTGGVTFDELIETYYVQAKALFDGGVDYFLLETCQDTRNIKAGLIAIQKVLDEKGEKLPIAISGTIEPMGTMLGGQTVEALAAAVAHLDLLYLGLNCATGPEFMTDYIRSLAYESGQRVGCVPNAGLPDEYGNYLETPESLAKIVENFGKQGWINVVGGCCGTTKHHIRALAEAAKRITPHQRQRQTVSILSGLERLEVTDEKRPLLVGERTNTIGSKKFKDLIVDGKFDEASEIARAQVKSGAHIIDICLANPDRDETADMKAFMEFVIKKTKAPLMLDSTDASVIELGLTYSQGKAIINSINLEDGEERFEQIVPLVKKYGAAVVVGTIDDDPQQGMGVTRKRKLEIANRSYDLLVNKYGIEPEDIYWDPLVFPCATGDAQYVGSAVETIEGIRIIKERYPETKTVLGISNVSFGLPPAGREVLNTVFLQHCVQAGLDLAIVNSEKLKRFTQITPEELKLSEDLLFNRGDDPVAAFAAFFRHKKVEVKTDRKNIPIEKRLSGYILEGTKEGLVDDLAEIIKTMKPLDIINGPLMAGMDEVGRLFNKNQLIVAEVLQSAESMKAAVAYLEPFMEKSDDSLRGKLVLATVKGDVHDIGKNLVDIILSNNGFKVINLGIKIAPDALIQAIREHKPDFVGLSGLLVKSAQQMVLTARDLSAAGINLPILVGGAALTRNFVDKQIAPSYEGFVDYASDAMHGLDLAKTLTDEDKFAIHGTEVKKRRMELVKTATPEGPAAEISTARSSEVSVLDKVPPVADYDRHVMKSVSIEQLSKWVNPLMIYTRHLGIKPKYAKAWESGDKKVLEESDEGRKAMRILEAVQEVRAKYRGSLVPKAVFQFVRAQSEGNNILIYDNSDKLITFNFPRQKKANGLCLSDYVLPKSSGRMDSLCFFATTVGEGVRKIATELKDDGQYLHSHIIQVVAMESAEAYAELLHSQIRTMWGNPDPVTMTTMEKFQAKYSGKRYSFGYPACPELANQVPLFEMLRPQDIGIELTDGYMMDPEASVTAVCFHHPQAIYYSVGSQLEEGG